MPRRQLGGTLTHWIETRGKDSAPTVLWLHCALGQALAWRPVLARLPAQRHLAVDLPGHGLSGPMDEGMEPTDQALAAIRSLLSEHQDPVFDLVGHSFGAVVALRLALECPDRIRSLVLAEPVLFAAVQEPQARADYAAQTEPLRAAFDAADWDLAARLFYELWGVGHRWGTLGPAERDYIRARMPMIPRTDPILSEDAAGLLPRLGRLTCPVLLVAGSRSPPITDAILTGLAARLPRVTRAMIPDAGHMFPVSHPVEFGDLVAGFQDRLDTSAEAQPVSLSGSMR